MISADAQPLQVSPTEHQGAEIGVDSLQQGLRRGRNICGGDIFLPTVPVDANVVVEISFASAAERFDGEDLAFLHALGTTILDEWDLLPTVNLVAEDVVTADTSDCPDGLGLAVDLDLVALHDFLDCCADVRNGGVDTGLLQTR